MKGLKRWIYLVCNYLTPKHKNRIYLKGRLVYPKSKCDLFNYGASNAYTFLYEYLRTHKMKKTITFYIEHGDMDRLRENAAYLEEVKRNNINLIFLKVIREEIPQKDVSKIKKLLLKLNNLFKRFSCRTWLCESGDTFSGGDGKLRCQKIISFSYFIPCKNDLIIGQNYRWSFVDNMVTTSLLSSQVLSSSTGVKLNNCRICGFPRNDVLFKTDKKEKILNWLKNKLGFIPKHIILYAPTYRDYETGKVEPVFFSAQQETELNNNIGDTVIERPMLGYHSKGFEEFLRETKTAFVYNLHRLQKVDVIQKDNNMIAYEENYDFTLYDLMAITDCLISDYSSISYDFLLLDRPIIFNLYDLDKYIRLRGVSYEPFEEFCPGAIVRNWEEMRKALTDVVEGVDHYKEHRRRICKLLHKYQDGNSTERVIAFFDTYLKELMG